MLLVSVHRMYFYRVILVIERKIHFHSIPNVWEGGLIRMIRCADLTQFGMKRLMSVVVFNFEL